MLLCLLAGTHALQCSCFKGASASEAVLCERLHAALPVPGALKRWVKCLGQPMCQPELIAGRSRARPNEAPLRLYARRQHALASLKLQALGCPWCCSAHLSDRRDRWWLRAGARPSAPLLRRWVSSRRPAPQCRPPRACRRRAMPACSPHTCAWRHARPSGALRAANVTCEQATPSLTSERQPKNPLLTGN